MTGRCPLAVLFGAVLLTAATARPANDGGWISIAPDGGAVAAVALAADGTVYAGTHDGGVFQTSKGRESWSSAGWPIQGAFIRDLAAHPSNPRVLFAALNEGVYRTVDGGARWLEILNVPALAVASAPSDPAVVYAGGSRLFKSADGGETWFPLEGNLGFVVALAVDPQDSRTVYAGGSAGLFRSLDGGVSWTAAGPRPPGAGQRYSLRELAADPTRPGTVWAGTSSGELFKSVDRGETWSAAGPELGLLDPSALAVDASGTVWAGFSSYRADGTGGVFKSLDGGVNWTRILPDYRVQDFAFDPSDPDRLYAASWRLGVLRSDDGGDTWTGINRGLQALVVSDLEIDPRPRGRLLVVAANSSSGGSSQVTAVLGGRAGEDLSLLLGRWEDPTSPLLNDLLLHPERQDVLYATHEDGVLRSLDDGRTWRETSRGMRKGEWVAALAVARSEPRVLYAAGWGAYPICQGGLRDCRLTRVYRSDDGGRRWTAPSRPLETERKMDVLEVDPERPSTVYIAGEKLFKSVDGARTWRTLGRGLEGIVQALGLAPGAPDVLYAATWVRGEGTRFYRSFNGGESWTAGGDLLPSHRVVNKLVPDPRDRGTVYAATDRGVYVTRDGGRSWASLNPPGSFLLVPVLDLAVDPRDGSLYAGTRGGGGLFVLQGF